MDEILEITLFVADVMDRLGVEWLVGGSLASSLHGIPRATQDVDLVAALRREHVEPFVAAMRGRFYLDEAVVAEAIESRRSFNVIDLRTFFKVDVFVAGTDPFSRAQLERRQRFRLADPERELVVASPEDVVAHKLYWFSLGDEVSERQWADAMGVIRVAADRLDPAYLRRAARSLGVEDLLDRALAEAGRRYRRT